MTVQLVPLIIIEAAFELQVQCDPDEEARMRNLPTKVKIYGIFQPCLVRLLAGLKLPVFTFLLNFFFTVYFAEAACLTLTTIQFFLADIKPGPALCCLGDICT